MDDDVTTEPSPDADRRELAERVARVIRRAFPDAPLVALAGPGLDPLRAFKDDLLKLSDPLYPWPTVQVNGLYRASSWSDFRRRVQQLPDLQTLVEAGSGDWGKVRDAIVVRLSDCVDRDADQYRYEASTRCHTCVPLCLPNALGEVDAALFMVAAGAVEGKVPLGLAVALGSPLRSTVDPFGLAEVARSYAVVPLTEAAEPEWLGVGLDPTNQSLVATCRKDGTWSTRVLAPLFAPREGGRRPRGGPPWAYVLRDERTLLAGAGRSDDREGLASAAAGYGYALGWAADRCDLLDEVERLLARARAGAAVPDTLAGASARGVLAAYAPLTGTLPALGDGDVESRLSPAECLDRAMPELAELASSPVRDEPYGAVAKLLLILAQMKRGRRPDGIVRPGPVRHSWHFKLRTADHTWIVGEIFRTAVPPALGVRPSPLALPAASCSGASDRYGDTAVSDWFGTPGLRCRVREQRS